MKFIKFITQKYNQEVQIKASAIVAFEEITNDTTGIYLETSHYLVVKETYQSVANSLTTALEPDHQDDKFGFS
ncbi:hypothetical protein BWI97_01585 [Siphonobacter sp. BAB-5405]|uniref:hypothetical protein n=1 Tax=Siphonobacter sp. BAB-5405 TaxID=1864825 RepID=UPI000C80B008|nr:hypothetical protein [Siphonobacter sp. BAB-5405]PMD99125.1 hypothetical protein BWI97_01585 [Siphonobacter sp. BAB-5405]